MPIYIYSNPKEVFMGAPVIKTVINKFPEPGACVINIPKGSFGNKAPQFIFGCDKFESL